MSKIKDFELNRQPRTLYEAEDTLNVLANEIQDLLETRAGVEQQGKQTVSFSITMFSCLAVMANMARSYNEDHELCCCNNCLGVTIKKAVDKFFEHFQGIERH